MHIAKVGAALLRMDAVRIARDLKKRWMGKTFPYAMHHRDEVARFDRLYLVRDPFNGDLLGIGTSYGKLVEKKMNGAFAPT